MAHFAKLGANGKVIQVLTLNNGDMLNADGVEDESVGQQYLETHNNWPADKWIQTSYNTINNTHTLGGTAFRGNYASIGFTWDSSNNIFWPPKPYPSWVKNTTTASWEAPVAKPALTAEQNAQNTKPDAATPSTHMWGYDWNEDTQSWDLTDTKA